MIPSEYYNQALASGHIKPDSQQRIVIEELDTICHALQSHSKKTWFIPRRKNNPVKGLYLWGSVGSGKTFLMDCFYRCVTVPKMRLHFHQFLLHTHEALQRMQGTKNPLQAIAKNLSQEVSVICFDEFFVSNIADAMILGELFLHLFENNVTLVTSSNVPPNLLYKEGLQRERFLPVITLIQQHTHVMHLHSKTDYRRQHIHQTGVYYTPLDKAATDNMENAFTHFSQGAEAEYDPIIIYDRPISVIKRARAVIWFDFKTICGRPRCQNDYLDITKNYHTILMQNLRAIKPNENDLILSFIYLVDILYDAHCRLVISSEVTMDHIVTFEKIEQPFQRTLSRLIEMQSEAYIYPETIEKEITQL